MKCKVKIKKEVEEYEQNDIELSTSVDLESGFKNEPVEDYPGMECKVEVKKEIEEYDQNDIELSTSVDLGDLKNEPGKDYPGKRSKMPSRRSFLMSAIERDDCAEVVRLLELGLKINHIKWKSLHYTEQQHQTALYTEL
uniref:Uncharacterized protein LOC114333974 isoform X2 n=1 Tax=Diabrotica virgifera virgifera TaxID=50390 RepID=A0A6P7FTN2_DIAVI